LQEAAPDGLDTSKWELRVSEAEDADLSIPIDKEASDSLDIPGEEAQAVIQKIVLLVDAGAISRKSYHELAQLCPVLPRLSHVREEILEQKEQIRRDLDVQETEHSCYVDMDTLMDRVCERRGVDRNTLKVVSFDGRAIDLKSHTNLAIIKLPRAEGRKSERKTGVYPFWLSTVGEKHVPLKDEWRRCGILDTLKKWGENWVLCCDGKAVNCFVGLTGYGTDGCSCPYCTKNRAERMDFKLPGRLEHDRLRIGKPGFVGGRTPLVDIEPCRIIPESMHLGNRIMGSLQKEMFASVMRHHGQSKGKKLIEEWYWRRGVKEFKFFLKVDKLSGKIKDFGWTTLPAQEHFRFVECLKAGDMRELFPVNRAVEADWNVQKWVQFIKLLRAVDVYGELERDFCKRGGGWRAPGWSR
jgi:hypothetical protein